MVHERQSQCTIVHLSGEMTSLAHGTHLLHAWQDALCHILGMDRTRGQRICTWSQCTSMLVPKKGEVRQLNLRPHTGAPVQSNVAVRKLYQGVLTSCLASIPAGHLPTGAQSWRSQL